MIVVERSDSAAPVDLVVGRVGGVSGLAAFVACRDAASGSSYLDFADKTFKASGWTTRQAPLTDLGDGFYRLTGGLDVAGITNLPASTSHLILEYEVSGAAIGVASETVMLTQGIYDIAASVWSRAINASSGFTFPSAARVLDRIRVFLTNRNEINYISQELIAYEDDGATVAQRWDIDTDGGENAGPVVGGISKRGAPKDPL